MPLRLVSSVTRGRRAASISASALALLTIAVIVTACSGSAPVTPTGTNSTTSTAAQAPSASAPAPSTPAAPALVPGGTAAENLPLFTSVVDAVWASPDSVTGRAYVDALVAAGFDKGTMQLTPDTTTVGNPAETVQFSVLWGEECLVGQVGPATGTAVTVVLPAVSGSCLVGSTRPIDW